MRCCAQAVASQQPHIMRDRCCPPQHSAVIRIAQLYLKLSTWVVYRAACACGLRDRILPALRIGEGLRRLTLCPLPMATRHAQIHHTRAMISRGCYRCIMAIRSSFSGTTAECVWCVDTEAKYLAEVAAWRWPVLLIIFCFDILIWCVRSLTAFLLLDLLDDVDVSDIIHTGVCTARTPHHISKPAGTVAVYISV